MSHSNSTPVCSPLAGVIITVNVSEGDVVEAGQCVAIVESMKMQTEIKATLTGKVDSIAVTVNETVQAGRELVSIASLQAVSATQSENSGSVEPKSNAKADSEAHVSLSQFIERQKKALDAGRQRAVDSRHSKGYRTARENVAALCDKDSFLEYGQMAVAAQRQRRDIEDLRENTAADGIITGLASINADLFNSDTTAAADGVSVDCRAAVVVNDYTVLAGSQGYFHHHKLDRILQIAEQEQLPVVMYTEGGGGRPGDVDVLTQIAGLNTTSFAAWARLSGQVPRIAVGNGYCFAGNAALFGCADITIATEKSWIGMAGPAMIEGGGLGSFRPTEIGPIDVQTKNGVVDVVARDEEHATELAQQLLSYFQGPVRQWAVEDQAALRAALPADRRYSYKIRALIGTLVDTDSFLELRANYGKGIVTAFARIEGRAVGILANDCRELGGAIDAEAADKAGRFMQLCDGFGIAIVSLCDTPGFMVGPASEEHASVRRMSSLFVVGASLTTPLVTIFLRKGYGLGAMAMAGGSFVAPIYSASWPTGEFGGMGLEGAVQLGFKAELEKLSDPTEKETLFNKLLDELYETGKATEAASFLEIDAVIDPADTRRVILRALAAHEPIVRPHKRRNMVDTW